MNFQDLRIIVGQIKKTIACPKCSAKYTDPDIEIIGSLSDDHTFFHAICPKCSAEAVINVSIQMDNTEIQIPELSQLAGAAPKGHEVTVNEVLDIHNFLESFDGNFKTLFKSKTT